MQGTLKDYQTQFHTGKVLGAHVMGVLNPGPDMRVLDLGCGDGHLTRQIADSGADVVGVDVDPTFVDAAVARGLRAFVKDGHFLDYKDEFDRVFSNATLHWLSADPPAVVRCVFEALHLGGEFIAEFGGHGNVGTIVSALEHEIRSHGHDSAKCNPWFFPAVEEYSDILKSAGFIVVSCELVQANVHLAEDIDMSGWLRTFCAKWLHGLSDGDAASILCKVREALTKTHLFSHGRWMVDYIRLRVHAKRPPLPAAESSDSVQPATKHAKYDTTTNG